MSAKVQTYADLQNMIRKALREQHPEWVDANGKCALCDAYEARFAHLLGVFASAAAGERVPWFQVSANGDFDSHERELASAANRQREIQ
jgi:hypothetical protein